jgi:hypothetical protein
MAISGVLARAAAIAAGVVLGAVVVAGVGSWRLSRANRDLEPTPPASVPHERAPDTRV